MIDKIYIFGVIIVYLQLFFLPGFLIAFKLKLNTNLLNLILISLTSSFIVNYFIVFLLVLLNVYNLFIIISIFFCEIYFIFLKWKSVKSFFFNSFILLKDQLKILNERNNKILKNVSFIILAYILFLTATIIYDREQNFTQIFFHGDALEWYLKWAREYYNNNIPRTQFLRPQMWSANISMFFIVFNTTQIEMFGKLIFNILPLFMLIAVTSISLSKQNLSYFISGCLGIILSLKLTFGQATSGYMEIPLGFSFLILMAFFFELKKKKLNDLQSNFIILSTFLFVMQTKELGWAVLILFIFLFYEKKFNLKFKNLKFLLFYGLILFLPFYIYQFYQYGIYIVDDLFKLLFFDEEFHNLADHDLRFLELNSRIILAFDKFPKYIFIALLLCLIFIKKDQIFDFFTYFIIIYISLWFTMFSNEIRYLFPIILITCLIGYGNLFDLINSKYEKNFKK